MCGALLYRCVQHFVKTSYSVISDDYFKVFVHLTKIMRDQRTPLVSFDFQT